MIWMNWSAGRLSPTVYFDNPSRATMTQRVLDWISTRLSSGQRVASATVLEAKGSVPGKPGARIALTNETDQFGTIGGAGLELKVVERLIEMLNSDTNGGEVATYGLNKGAKGYEVTPLDSLCGGQVTLSLETVNPMPHLLLMGDLFRVNGSPQIIQSGFMAPRRCVWA